MKLFAKVHLWLALFLLLRNGLVFAAGGVQQMQQFLTGLDTLSARFEQTLTGDGSVRGMRSSGVFYLQRPRQFRWDYLEPEKQQIVADGRQIWLYDQELEQVSVQSQDTALQGTPAMLLTGGESVEQRFEVTEAGQRQGLDWVQLIPRSEEGQFTRILLAFSDSQLRVMEMADKFGQTTRLHFYDIDHNPRFDDWFFRFERPENVDLYNQ